MKRLTSYFLFAVALGGLASFALAMPTPTERRDRKIPDRGDSKEAKQDFLRRTNAQLRVLASILSELHQERPAYQSIDNYLATEDVEHQLTDLRSAWVKLQALPVQEWGKTRALLETRVEIARQSLVKLGEEK